VKGFFLRFACLTGTDPVLNVSGSRAEEMVYSNLADIPFLEIQGAIKLYRITW